MVQRGAWMGEVDDGQSFNTGVVPHEAWWNMQELAKKVILDLGCMRNVVGVKWATDVIEAWKSNQRWFKIIPEAEVFRFGDGNTLRSRYRLQLEATFGGRRVLLAFSVVPGPCPPLLSKQSHTKLGVRLDTEHHTMSSRKLRVQNYGLVETDAGHYTMRIDEFHLLPPDDETWKEAGKTVMLSDDEVALFEPAQPDAEVFGSVVDQLNSVPLDEVQPSSSSQSAAMPTVRVFGASDKELSQPCGGKRRGALRDLGDTEHAGRGREGASQAGAEEHGTGSDSCSEPANSEVHQAAKGGSSCQGLPGSLDRSSSGGVHGCRLAGVGSRGSSFDLEEEGQTSSQQEQEGSIGSADRCRSRVPVPVELLEQRVDLQHPSQYGESAPDLSMEEAGVATPDQGGCEDGVQRKGNLEEKPEMADLPPELRDCGVVGALWGNEAEAEVNRLPESTPKPSLKPVKPQRGVTQKLKKGLEENWRIQELVAELITMEDHYLLIELFAGCARLSRMAKNREGWVAMDPVDLIYGHDLKDKRTQREILYLIRRLKPDLVTMSPRCGPWSQFQRINPNIDKVMSQREADLPLWRFCREVWDEQDNAGRWVLMENPAQSEAWNIDCMKGRPNVHRAKVPQCAFGLRDVINGKPHQKYTALDVNNEAFKNELLVGAVCNHAPGEHQPIEGHVFWEGRSQRRSALAARWPEAFCQHMLEAAERAWEKCDEEIPVKFTEGRQPGGSHYVLPVEPMPTVDGELRRQLEKADWRGGQYDYVYFEGTARQGPYKIRQALAHLHVALGHPSQERLMRMLMVSGCGTTVTKVANGLRCQICEAVRPPGAEPKVSGQRPTRFGEKILSDSFYVWDIKGERFNVTHIIDALTEYQVGVVSKNWGAEVTAELLQHRWCAVFGPPELLQTDAGREYEDVIQKLSRVLDFRHEVVPPGAKWRQGQVERHGAVVKLMMMRVIHSQQAQGLEEVKMVASACFAAKNRLCNRMGLSPLQAITGRNTAVPASIMDQLCSGHIKQAMNEQLAVKDALRRAERIRAAAVDSFNWVDSNEVIRKGLHARSRPPKLEAIQEGCTVYVHDPPPSRRGQSRRLQDHSSWDGPALVVCVERHQNVPNRIWVRLRTKVKSYPLEKVRLATPDEMLGSQFVVQVLHELTEEIKSGKLVVEPEAPSAAPEPRTKKRAARLDALTEEELVEEILQDNGPQPVAPEEAQIRPQQVRRLEILNDLPEVVRRNMEEASASGSNSSSSAALARRLDSDERREMLAEDEDDAVGGASSAHSAAPLGETHEMSFKKKRQFFEDFSRRIKSKPSVLTEAQLRSGLEEANHQVRGIRRLIHKNRHGAVQAQARRSRNERTEAGSMVLCAEVQEDEGWWRDLHAERELHEVLWNQPQMCQEAEQQVLRQKQQMREGHAEDAAKAGLITGKARLEYQWNGLNEQWKKAFQEPLLKAVRIYFDHDALTGVPQDKVVDPKRILTSRFVLTNKGGETLETATLKARLILGGHKDPDMGKFPTLAPTAALLAHNLINWVAVQKSWVVKYEDVSSAFLQGKPLPPDREVYIRLPRGYPDYIQSYIKEKLGGGCRQNILKMVKGGFGLPESPRLWYLCYKDTLCQCGMKEMHLLPGVFAAHHPDGRLRALACIHVDDTRYCGDETSEEIWKKVHQHLNFGDLRRSTDGWVKFCGRWERQDPQTYEFEYSMNDYATKLQKMPFPKKAYETKNVDLAKNDEVIVDEKVPENDITAAQKLEMSSLLGQLNWMARQGRYDLSYGVSHVQQLASRDGKAAIEWLNKVIYRAKQPTTQVIRKFNCSLEEILVLSASDAAFGAQPGGASQGGMVIALAEPSVLDGEGAVSIVEAASMKIQRVVRCSMSAEVSMAATSFEHGDFVRAALSEMLHHNFLLSEWKLWASKWRHFLIIDAKTGFDVLNSESQTSDRKIQIDLAVLKQALMEGHANFAKWVPGHHMVADGMTKWYGNNALQKALEKGIWSLRDTDVAQGLRHEAAKRRRAYKHPKDQLGDV